MLIRDSIKYLSRWMSKLPQELQNIPLNALAIPGSHDSFAFYLNKHDHLGPSFNWLLRDLEKLLEPFIGDAIYRWSVTQSQNLTEQLSLGIRYFDFRIARKPGTDEIYLLHGYYGDELPLCLDEIKDFLLHNPQEVVFLDFNHIYNMDDFYNKQCMSMLLEKFGDMMCPFQDVKDITLHTLWSRHQQLLVFYQTDVAKQNPMFWPGEYMPSPWANTTDTNKLFKFLDEDYAKGREVGKFHVTQGILTPSVIYILEHLCSSLKADMAAKVDPMFVKWLETKCAGAQGINICIVDFVEMANYTEAVIGLNRLMLKHLRAKQNQLLMQ